jgi:hypothetical protein
MVFFLQANRQIRDLFEDLRSGHNLISLLEVLTGEQLVSIVFSRQFVSIVPLINQCYFEINKFPNRGFYEW